MSPPSEMLTYDMERLRINPRIPKLLTEWKEKEERGEPDPKFESWRAQHPADKTVQREMVQDLMKMSANHVKTVIKDVREDREKRKNNPVSIDCLAIRHKLIILTPGDTSPAANNAQIPTSPAISSSPGPKLPPITDRSLVIESLMLQQLLPIRKMILDESQKQGIKPCEVKQRLIEEFKLKEPIMPSQLARCLEKVRDEGWSGQGEKGEKDGEEDQDQSKE